MLVTAGPSVWNALSFVVGLWTPILTSQDPSHTKPSLIISHIVELAITSFMLHPQTQDMLWLLQHGRTLTGPLLLHTVCSLSGTLSYSPLDPQPMLCLHRTLSRVPARVSAQIKVTIFIYSKEKTIVFATCEEWAGWRWDMEIYWKYWQERIEIRTWNFIHTRSTQGYIARSDLGLQLPSYLNWDACTPRNALGVTWNHRINMEHPLEKQFR